MRTDDVDNDDDDDYKVDNNSLPLASYYKSETWILVEPWPLVTALYMHLIVVP